MSLTHLKTNTIPYNGLFVCCCDRSAVIGKSVSGQQYLAQDLPHLPCGIHNDVIQYGRDSYYIRFCLVTPTPTYGGFLFLSGNSIHYRGEIYQLSWKRVSYDHAKFYCLDFT